MSIHHFRGIQPAGRSRTWRLLGEFVSFMAVNVQTQLKMLKVLRYTVYSIERRQDS